YQPKPLEVVVSKILGQSSEDATLPAVMNKVRIPVPKDAKRDCPSCKGNQNWRWEGVAGSDDFIGFGLKSLTYRCRNCGTQSVNLWIRVWLESGTPYIEKVGQHPKLAITL